MKTSFVRFWKVIQGTTSAISVAIGLAVPFMQVYCIGLTRVTTIPSLSQRKPRDATG